MPQTIRSKSINVRHDSFSFVHSAHRDSIDLIAAFFESHYGAGMGDHVRAVFTPVMAELVTRNDEMRSANQKLTTERAESVQATADRDRLAGACQQLLLALRDTYFAMFGEEYVRSIGLIGAVPEQPQSIHSVAAFVLKRVAELPAPKNLLTDAAIDPKTLAVKLTEPTAQLGAALLKARNEKRDSDGAQLAKDSSVVEFDRAFKVAAGLLSTFLEACGDSKRAKRVRPSSRRSGTLDEIVEEEVIEEESATTTDETESTEATDPAATESQTTTEEEG
jgi:hypothetical protein